MPNNILTENPENLDPLINTIKDLTRVISEETILLKTNRPKELEKFLPLKNQLMASYQKEMTDLNNRGGLLGGGNGPALRQLKQESRIFQSVLTRHTRLVKALKTISENMIKTISNEVVKRQNQTSQYDAGGSKAANKNPTSITLNQTI
ncbi:hypothetical protein MNBD_ALPHA02-1888 [hydrothermal vent metagenome]|uniref:Uncharacterized protein n=1 Tax=hydrothermal vent metagenome TaxID=652676 RepID=A0A3B0R773_9ZZZZ